MAVGDDVERRGSQVALGPDIAECDEALRRFGANLKGARQGAGLSQSMLSQRSFVRSERISVLERGVAVPNLLVALILCDALDVSLNVLVDGVQAPTRHVSRLQMRELIEQRPGISSEEIANALGLPSGYVLENGRWMFSHGEIRGRSRSWQPAGRRGPSPG